MTKEHSPTCISRKDTNLCNCGVGGNPPLDATSAPDSDARDASARQLAASIRAALATADRSST